MPAAPAQPSALSSTPLWRSSYNWAAGSLQRPVEIWAGAQNSRAEIAIPATSKHSSRSPTLEYQQEMRTEAANDKWVLLAVGWPSVWEKCH